MKVADLKALLASVPDGSAVELEVNNYLFEIDSVKNDSSGFVYLVAKEDE